MGIELKFLTDDPGEIEIVERYWALNPDGTFCGSVISLLPFRETQKARDLVALVQSYATAYYTGTICPDCGRHPLINTRSDYKVVHYQKLCQHCEDDAILERIIEDEEHG
ncbi:hypothetical protein QAO71_17445 (plasmid) [Halopseudomonas sp. SMJS2]|uniref:hypothetical protein n=1 Tax=Halopseudomonas sp. SMJS2 TaxID=3041098 RepID=UPI002452AA7E|nr:hypothetical protein [Halopseudomonas sp. SMJS2]WGK63554.1 hypothetical protein QAO71_17445 [Halopseudomonas sp. SMJS2]